MNTAKPDDDFSEQDKTRQLWECVQKWKESRKNGRLTVYFKHGKICTIEQTQMV